MATARLSPYEKALRRALRLQGALLCEEIPSETRIRKTDEAWREVVQRHWEEHPEPQDCPWCERFLL